MAGPGQGGVFSGGGVAQQATALLLTDGGGTVISGWQAGHGAPDYTAPFSFRHIDVDTDTVYVSDGSAWAPDATGTDFGSAGLSTDLISESTIGAGVDFTGLATADESFIIRATGEINHATNDFRGIESVPTATTTARTNGYVDAFSAAPVGLAGDTSGATYVAFDALNVTANGGSAVYEVVKQGTGYTWTIDSSGAATTEAGWKVGSNKASALKVGNGTLTYGLLGTATATPGMDWTFTATAADTGAWSMTGSINHATANYTGALAHATQLTTARTAGQVNAQAASCTSLAGDTSSVLYVDFDAQAPTDGGGTVLHVAFKVEAGHDRALDLTACATGEGVCAVADNLAVAFAIKEATNSYYTVVTTNGSESNTFGQPTTFNAAVYSGVTTTQSIDTGGTIALPTTGKNTMVATSSAADKTGVILEVGLRAGQEIVLMNNSANSLTFAAAGTSHVSVGSTITLAAGRRLALTWDATSALWYA